MTSQRVTRKEAVEATRGVEFRKRPNVCLLEIRRKILL